MVLIEGCAIICLIGSLFLIGLGILLTMGYEYIQIRNISQYQAGITCLWAAMIYVMILLIILLKLRRKRHFSEALKDTDSDSSDEEAPFINLYKKRKFQ